MALADALLPEFDHEMANTRKTLERVPDAKFDWRPHEKSMTLRGLATHLSNLPSWVAVTLEQDSFDMAPKEGGAPQVEPVASARAALESFDRNVTSARTIIQGTSDLQFHVPWTLLAGGEQMFSMPKIAVLRSFVMNHMIHHRAQLAVYLRMNDVPVPALYGPSADESA